MTTTTTTVRVTVTVTATTTTHTNTNTFTAVPWGHSRAIGPQRRELRLVVAVVVTVNKLSFDAFLHNCR